MGVKSAAALSTLTAKGAGTRDYGNVLKQVISKSARNLSDLNKAPASWGFDEAGDYPARNEGFYDIDNWTTSFFSGTALIAHQLTGDDFWIRELEELRGAYRKKVTDHAADTMHDLGFLYSLYSVGMFRVTGHQHHRDTGLLAANALSGRFVSAGNYFQAWGRMDEEGTDYSGLAIIDSLMNLPLLYWAAEASGDEHFRRIAVAHSETAIKQFIRLDGSVFHAYRFDPVTGNPVGGDNYCGRAVNSHWARGSAWAMLGLALGYRYTRRDDLLEASVMVADAFISHLDPSFVPIWDFRLSADEDLLRDSSAAAIAVCAIQELERHRAAPDSASNAKWNMLDALCSPQFLNTSSLCRGLLKQGQVGDGIGKARNVYTSWGDYFFAQALASEAGLEFDCW